MTGPGHLRDDIDLSNSTIDVEVPAISVGVNCTDADMSIWAQYTDSTDCWTFHADCASQQCKDLIPVDDEPGTYYLDGNSGASCPGSNATFVGMTAFGPSAYRVLLADYTSVKQQPFTNATPWGTTKAYKSYNLTTGFLAPDSLTVPLPTLRAVSCALSLAEVSVRTTYAYSPSSSSSSTWTPRAYDPHSIAPVRAYNASASPSWLRPYAYASNGSALLDLHDLTLAAPGRLASSSSLWPTRGAALNFFELLAAHAVYDLQRNNASALLLDRQAFNDAVSDMVAAYTVEMLTEMRPFAAAAAAGGAAGAADTTRRGNHGTGTAGSETAPGNGTITFFAPRIMQSPQATWVTTEEEEEEESGSSSRA
ncbi:hypothetical protein UCDDS831_g08346 [Diplodia seriata]|uniref:Uncharacterized protein n=1 Tax=Diplodia seriata TaxID=420778 RepID=A0A0G2DVM6_9PEZI|nr:hypothetical protein UCDDS831_g08346 [Diplodia seriata]